MHKLLLVSIASPLIAGVYKDGILLEVHELEGKASTDLPLLLRRLMERFRFEEFIYVNTPGSFMAIKIAYVTLKTLSIIKKIPLKALDGFQLNGNKPIKAIGKLYFIKEDGKIATKKFQDHMQQRFTLPERLDTLTTSDDNAPEYEIPAV